MFTKQTTALRLQFVHSLNYGQLNYYYSCDSTLYRMEKLKMCLCIMAIHTFRKLHKIM